MPEERNGITRRRFIASGIRGAGLVGLGGAIGVAASRFLANTTSENPGRSGNLPGYDLKEFSEVDPALIRYKEAGRIEVPSRGLHGIAVGPDDRVYVAADKTIQVFDADAARLSKIQLNDSPRCLTVAGDGAIYVGMKDRVDIYDRKGSRKHSWETPGQSAFFTSIAVSESDVFVADAGNREVLRYDASGKLVRRIGKRDVARNIPGFVVPSPYFDVAVAPDGLLRVANPGRHRVEAYTFDGDFEFSWGETSMDIEGFCGCCNPIDFAMLPDGRFVTCEKGLPRAKVYDADGTFASVVAGPEAFLENGRTCTLDDLSNCQTGGLNVAVDSQGHVLVMDPIERVVRIFAEISKS